VDVLLFPARV